MSVVAPLTELDEALNDSLEHIAESAVQGLASRVWRWAETEASARELAEFHGATAAYHRAAPWRVLEDRDALLLTFPGEEEPWAASVMGSGSIHYGLALYSDPADLADMLGGDGDPSDDAMARLRGITLSLSFDPAGKLSRPMRREVASAGWEVAAPDAYPTLLALRVPGRRITPELLRRTAIACQAVVAFAAEEEPELPWTDAATGVEVDTMFCDADGEHAPELPWRLLEASHPVGPAGPSADPSAVLDVEEDWETFVHGEEDRLARFDRWLRTQKPSRAAYEREMRTAHLWARMLAESGTPAVSVTEYDLRFFLYGYLVHRRRPSKTVAKFLTRSLARLFRFYAQREGIVYPWADGVLSELGELAGDAEDLWDVLDEAAEAFPMDVVLRVIRPQAEVSGTRQGWSGAVRLPVVELRNELHRRWLIWHDEVVRAGITDPGEVRQVLLGRQREWENTPHSMIGGKTPKQALIESEKA